MNPKIMITRKEKGTHFSRWICIALILLLLVVFYVQVTKAQPSTRFPNGPILERQETCWQSPDLALTETQVKAIKDLQCAYAAEATPLRKELLSLRFERRQLVRDSNVQSKVLLDRQNQISELQARLETLSLSYQIKARSILAREQLERLPADCSLGMDAEFELMMGIRRAPRKGLR